ncbi:MAG TPA: hypothetical protein VFT01_08410, partial [Homoserinimonas sp.]|nr:hypothetical protein [Homoserinimonas sp.]
MLAALVLFVAVMLGAGIPAAWAEESSPTPPPSPAPTPSAAPATVAITSPVDGAFLPGNTVTISGSKSAGSSVSVTATGSAGCSAPVADPLSTSWSCDAVLPNGPGLQVKATETLPDATTSQNTVTVDVLGPPVINPAPPQEAP